MIIPNALIFNTSDPPLLLLWPLSITRLFHCNSGIDNFTRYYCYSDFTRLLTGSLGPSNKS